MELGKYSLNLKSRHADNVKVVKYISITTKNQKVIYLVVMHLYFLELS